MSNPFIGGLHLCNVINDRHLLIRSKYRTHNRCSCLRVVFLQLPLPYYHKPFLPALQTCHVTPSLYTIVFCWLRYLCLKHSKNNFYIVFSFFFFPFWVLRFEVPLATLRYIHFFPLHLHMPLN